MQALSLAWIITWSDVLVWLAGLGFYFLGFRHGKRKGIEEEYTRIQYERLTKDVLNLKAEAKIK